MIFMRMFPSLRAWHGTVEGLPDHQGELAVERHMSKLAAKNRSGFDPARSLSAPGPTSHHVPATVDMVIQRSEFLTTYTPYQPEIAQGTLQTLFEFQTQVAASDRHGCGQRLHV